MKINVEVDIEPEELRRLVGLPDMQPLWEAVYHRVSDGDAELIQSLAKTALNEGMKTLDLTTRFIKGLSGLSTKKEGESKSPLKATAEKAASAAKAATGSSRKRPTKKPGDEE